MTDEYEHGSINCHFEQAKIKAFSSKIYLLAFQEHVWVPFSEAPPVCSERCAAEYILGIEDKKK